MKKLNFLFIFFFVGNPQKRLLLLFTIAGIFCSVQLNAQFGPCANNNNTEPPAGPPLAPENTLEIDGLNIVPNSDFCLGNMNPPEPQTLDGCGTFLITNIPPGIGDCDPELCFVPKQGCGNAIGNVCLWVEDPDNPGNWLALGEPTAANGEVCLDVLDNASTFAVTICRPGQGPVSIQDVTLTLCCPDPTAIIQVTPNP